MNRIVLDDNSRFELSTDDCLKMTTFVALMENVADMQNQEVPIPQISGDTFSAIYTYLQMANQHNDIETVTSSKVLTPHTCMPEVVTKFLDSFSDDQIEQLLMATNQLGYKQMLDMLCLYTAKKCVNMTPSEVYAFIGFSNEEIAELERI